MNAMFYSTIEWRSHKGFKPPKNGTYLCLTGSGLIIPLPYDEDKDAFNYHGDDNSIIEVIYWAKIPTCITENYDKAVQELYKED